MGEAFITRKGSVEDTYYIDAYLTLNGTGSLEGITVTATNGSSSYSEVTNASGRCSISVPKNRTYSVTASKGTALVSSTGSVVTSQKVTDVTLTAFYKPTVTVTVTDESGEGYESGRIISYTDGTNTYTGTTNSSGVATITFGTLGTFTASMTNTPTDGDVTFTPASVTVDGNGTYAVACVISFDWCYGVRITIGESDPATAVTYTDDCVGWNPMSFSGTTFNAGSWANAEIWENIDPVAYNGTTDVLLNKTNLTQDRNGSTVDATIDRFTRIKKMWLDIHNDGSYIYVRVASKQVNANFSDWYFRYNGTVQECMRIGCYLAYETSSKMYSRSSVSPTGDVNLIDFITYAQARGTGYDLFRYNQLILIQALYVIFFKNLDSQSVLGQGYTGGSAKTNTGANNTLVNEYGMYGSTTSGTTHVSFLWIEDFYGNLLQWIGGMGTTNVRKLAISDKSSTNISGWETADTGGTSNISGYISQAIGTAKTGFCPKVCNGSSTTYYCDYVSLYSSKFPNFGGHDSSGSGAGAFGLYVNLSATNAYANLGARLSYSGGL